MKILIANWKMNPATLKEALKLAHGIARLPKQPNVEIVVCPPFPYLEAVSGQWPSFALGAQDAFWESTGPYTGAVSPTMLKSLGVRRVILGHSERRRLMGETDEMVNKKIAAVLQAGLRVVLCVGEDKAVRDSGINFAQKYVREQLRRDLNLKERLDRARITHRSLAVAYEPIWALSTTKSSRPDTPADAAAMVLHIKSTVKELCGFDVDVYYGGSVNATTVAGFLERREIDGALIGAASLNAAEFQGMVRLAGRVK